MNILMDRTSYWHIAAPLICHHPFSHCLVYDTQDLRIEEKLRSKTGRFKWHGQEVSMRTAIRMIVVSIDIVHEARPQSFMAGLDQGCGKMCLQDTEALLLQFRNFIFGRHKSSIGDMKGKEVDYVE